MQKGPESIQGQGSTVSPKLGSLRACLPGVLLVAHAENNLTGPGVQRAMAKFPDWAFQWDGSLAVVAPGLSPREAGGRLAQGLTRGLGCRVWVGCSRATDSQNLATAHSQASSALEIGRRMLPSQDVFTYQNLLPWELVSALEPAKLQQILTGISSGLLPLDPETLKTANAFLANNLSLANTARVLFIHRNTLVYRLEKLHRNTGFDLRQFNDAMIFKLIMLIAEYSGTGEGSRQCELVSI